MITGLNIVIVFCCATVAGLEGYAEHYPQSFIYASFGCGYLGLAWLYGGA